MHGTRVYEAVRAHDEEADARHAASPPSALEEIECGGENVVGVQHRARGAAAVTQEPEVAGQDVQVLRVGDAVAPVARTQVAVRRERDLGAPRLRAPHQLGYLPEIGPRERGVQHDGVAAPHPHQLGHGLVQAGEQSTQLAERIVTLIGEVQRDREQVHARVPEGGEPLLGERPPVGDADDQRKAAAAAYGPCDVFQIGARERLSSAQLGDTGTQLARPTGVVRRLEETLFAFQPTLVAMKAVRSTGVGHLERHADGSPSESVRQAPRARLDHHTAVQACCLPNRATARRAGMPREAISFTPTAINTLMSETSSSQRGMFRASPSQAMARYRGARPMVRAAR